MTIRQFQRTLEQDLAALGAESPRFDAAQLLRWLSGQDQAWLIAHTGDACPEDWQARSVDALHRLESGEPLQYLLGEWEFYGLPLAVGPGVLIPRADTETIVETCLLALAPVPDPAIWDLCSGSGAIALALASRRPDARILAAELSEEALPYLRQNIAALAPDQVTAVQTDVLTQLPDGLCDLIVSNPPYIETEEIAQLMPEVRDHEPRLALDGMSDGLYYYRSIVSQCRDYLKEDGALLFEIGAGQGAAVSELLKEAGFVSVQVIKDLAGLDRVVAGKAGTKKGKQEKDV